MSRSARTGQVLLVALGLLCAVIAVSVYAAPDPFESDAQALIASYGVAFGLAVVLMAAVGLPSRTAWATLWLLPAFLLSHVALLGTALPDLPLAAIAVVALVLTRPQSVVYRSPSSPVTSAPSSSRTRA